MNNLARLNPSDLEPDVGQEYKQLQTFYDAKYKIGWFRMNGAPRPSVTRTLLRDIKSYIARVKQEMQTSNGQKYDFLVLASAVDDVFNLGGDLDLFTRCIASGNRDLLLQYATDCVDIQYQNLTHYDQPITSISLVQGDALGGGFEAALSCNVLIAEKGVKMGFPEVLFNMFPGMGAYSILSRKIGSAAAERMILGGKTYSSEQMYDMGIVDVLCDEGDGDMAVYRYVRGFNKTRNTSDSMRQVRDRCNPISYQELLDITTIWVDAVFKLSDRDLRMMHHLVRGQNRKMSR
jgi:DSF synthase